VATAQYETRSVTATAVVLVMTEDEADDLRALIGAADATPNRVAILKALASPVDSTSSVEHSGRVYEMGVRYVDDTGDVWTFRRDSEGTPVSTADSWAENRSLEYVVREYGPLRKQGS
jgi:hypothetical protein